MPIASRRRGLVVLGMHRSGTSALTRAVNLLGAGLGDADDLYLADDNPGGHWESRALIECNERILMAFGGTWWKPPRFSENWECSRTAETLLENMRTTFDSVYGSAGEPWLWKDPRLCLTLPLWRRVLDHPYVLLVLREPSAVARSLHARDGLRRSYAFALWERYLRSALTAADGLPTVIVRYEDVLADPTAAVAEVRSKLDEIGLTLPGDPATAATHISSPRPSAASAGHAGSRPQQELLDAIAQMPRAASAFRPPAIRPERWLSRRWRFNRIDARRSGILQLTRP